MNFKLTKEQYLKLYDGDISKREYDAIINQITDRFNYIIRDVMASKVVWWDFSNGYGETYGYFDPKRYDINGNITLAGEYTIPQPYVDSDFPIRWLWEDFEEEFKKDVEQYKQDQIKAKEKLKKKREVDKTKKAEMKKIISEKLTKEELKFIKFK